MASYTFKTQPKRSLFIPVKISNPDADDDDDAASIITVEMEVDTGASKSRLHYRYADQLGLDLKSGNKVTVNTLTSPNDEAYEHDVIIQIGNLKPINSTILFKDPQDYGLLGRHRALHYYNVVFNGGTSVTFTELTPREKINLVSIRSYNNLVNERNF